MYKYNPTPTAQLDKNQIISIRRKYLLLLSVRYFLIIMFGFATITHNTNKGDILVYYIVNQ
jgi:hypothetical protein